MRTEVQVIGGIHRLSLYRRDCTQCGEVRLFKGVKCTTCGWCFGPSGQGRNLKMQPSIARKVAIRQASKDRMTYYRAQAEASRKKWESS